MCDILTIDKARKRSNETWRRKKASEVNRLERAYAPALSGWLDRFALRALRDLRPEIERAMAQGKVSAVKKVMVTKAIDLSGLDDQLLALYQRFGLRAYNEAGKDASKAIGSDWQLKPDIVAQYNDELETKVSLLIAETEDRVRASVRRIVSDSLREERVPSAKEVGRRIARQWMGPPSSRPDGFEGVWPGRGTAEERRVTADWARNQEQLKGGAQESIFSFRRAQTIARTEIGQAQQAATAEGLEQAGIEWVKWLARPFNPGHDKAGARNHFLMNKHPQIRVVDMRGSDESKWFELPSGIRTPWPQWIGLPAGESVNCQCATAPGRS